MEQGRARPRHPVYRAGRWASAPRQRAREGHGGGDHHHSGASVAWLPRPAVGRGAVGGRDRNLRGAARKLGQALETLGVDHDVKEYPQAGHAFLNDHRGEGPWSVLYVVLGHLPVIAGYFGAYHQPSAQDARHLKSES